VEDRKFICPCYRHEQDIAETSHCLCHLFVSEDYMPEEAPNPPPRKEGDPWPPITLYCVRWCADSIRARRFLNKHGIPYTLIDIEEDAEAAQRVSDWNDGNLSTPTVDIDGRIVTEPSDDDLAWLLGLAS
jgi:mycoredoxin